VKQEINLYQPILRQRKKVFSARALLQASAVVVVGLLSLYGYGLWQIQSLQGELAGLQGQRDVASMRLVQLSDELLPNRKKSRLIEGEVARLSRELEERHEVQALLTSGAYGNQGGFSEYLAGLARQRVDGLWLTGVEISEGRKDVEISGSALSPELLPMFVQRLADESAFEGTRFETVRMVRPEVDVSRVDFELRTSTGDG